MAVKYLRSAAAGAGTGADWTNAYTTLALAFAGVSAGDTIYVADDHAETQSTAMALNSPGTASAPVRVICVNTHVTTPPVGTAVTATISTTSTGTISIQVTTGYAYYFGVTFNCGTGSSSTDLIVCANPTSSQSVGVTLDSCLLSIVNTASASSIRLGTNINSRSIGAARVNLINTPVKFAAVGQTINMGLVEGFWKSTASAVQGSIPTNLFTIIAAQSGFNMVVVGVDLSALTSGKSLVLASALANGLFRFLQCKLGSSVSVISGAIPAQGAATIELNNCDSSNTNYRMEHYKFQGSIVQETTIVRSSGASDGTTPISHKYTSVSSGPSLFTPLEGPWMLIWNELTGSSKTVTVQFLHDSVTNLKNDDIYLEVDYLGTSSFPLSLNSSSRVTDVFTTAADCAAGIGTGSWTTTGLTNPNSQKLTVSFTPQVKGLVRVRACIIKANYTVYIDPYLTIS